MGKRAIFVAVFLGICAGCSTVQEGLIGDTRANVEPFAKETINALVVDTIDFRDSELVYLRDMVSPDTPEIVRLRGLLKEVTEFRRELIIYSLELVRVTDMNSSEEAQINALADALVKQLREDYINFLNQPAEEFDNTVANIRVQEEFLDAVKAVEPIIEIAASHHKAILDEIESDALPAARDYIDAVIAAEFGEFLTHTAYMADRKDQILVGLRLVRAARLGDAAAVSELRDSNTILAKDSIPPVNPNEKDLDKTEKYLISELEKQVGIEKLLAQDRADYLATRAELEREVTEISAGVRTSRMRINAWLQAHEALANGVKNPGKWLSATLGIAGTVNQAL